MSSKTSPNPPFPQGCISVRDVMDGKPKPGDLVNIVALVKDCRLPIPTARTDFKCTLRLYDISTQDGLDDLSLVIFRAEQHMPQVGVGDVIIMQGAKVQRYKGDLTLITHLRTCLHVYQAASIPQYPKSPSAALRPDPKNPASKPLLHAESYVSWLYHSINKDCLPSEAQFRERAEQSLNLKDKFSRLESVRDGRFHDLIVRVVREPYDLLDKATVWITDYTENEAFFPMTSDGRDMDSHGYTSEKTGNASQSSWEGPFGKRCMQLTCFETHAAAVKRCVHLGDYVRFKNIQIKYGHNGQNLEGFLRQDRDAASSKIQVEVLDVTDAENVDPNLKELIRRKRAYEKERKRDIKLDSSGAGAGTKRPVADESGGKRLNAKKRRALERAAVARTITPNDESARELALGLNEHVKCENTVQPVTAVKTVLERVTYRTTSHGSALDIQLPFTCVNYRVNARVIDFHPPRLLDFACSRKTTEYDMLSECSNSSSDMEGEAGNNDDARGRVWEWRFALRLEEASASRKRKDVARETMWVFVDNRDAQLLTGLDACDLRTNPKTLSELRERLFTLWGNLEELKTKQSRATKAEKVAPRLNHGPPPDSSDNEDIKSKRKEDTAVGDAQGASDLGPPVSNRPFSCCVRQYGVRVPENNHQKANAGAGKRWERAYGLFGTKVPYM